MMWIWVDNIFFTVAMVLAYPHLKIIFIVICFKKKWFENPGRDSLVSERSFEYLGLWGDFRLNGLHYFRFWFSYVGYTCLNIACIDI